MRGTATENVMDPINLSINTHPVSRADSLTADDGRASIESRFLNITCRLIDNGEGSGELLF